MFEIQIGLAPETLEVARDLISALRENTQARQQMPVGVIVGDPMKHIREMMNAPAEASKAEDAQPLEVKKAEVPAPPEPKPTRKKKADAPKPEAKPEPESKPEAPKAEEIDYEKVMDEIGKFLRKNIGTKRAQIQQVRAMWPEAVKSWREIPQEKWPDVLKALEEIA